MSAIVKAPNAFVAWLRQMRRAAWTLILFCMIFRIGDAVVHDGSYLASTAPALAGGLP